MEKRLAQSLQYPAHKYASCFGNAFPVLKVAPQVLILTHFMLIFPFTSILVILQHLLPLKALSCRFVLSMFDLLVAPNAAEY